MLKFIISIILFAFGFLVFNDVKAQNSKRFVIQYKIDLNDSVNRESFMTKMYNWDLISDDSLRHIHFKTVQQCQFLADIRRNFFKQENFYDFYNGQWNEPLDETAGAYEKGILPTLYLSYEAIWDEDLQDFHYYPSLQNEDFPFITLELENEENKPTMSYSPSSQTDRNLIWNNQYILYKTPSNSFDYRTINDIVILRKFKGKINKVYNYSDKTQTTISNQNEFEKWKISYAKPFSSVLKYNYAYTPEQLFWSQGLSIFNSDENYYYFKISEHSNYTGYTIAMDVKAPENAKFLLNGKNIFMHYFKEFAKENPEATYTRKFILPITKNPNEDYIFSDLSVNYSISRNKRNINATIDKYYTDDEFYDSQKDSVSSIGYNYEQKFYDYLHSKNPFFANDFYYYNFNSYLVERGKDTTVLLTKRFPYSLSLEELKKFISEEMQTRLSEIDESTSLFNYLSSCSIRPVYKLTPSKKKKENTLFTYKKQFIEQIIEAVQIGIIRPYTPNLESYRESQEDFLNKLKFLKDYFGGTIPYEKLDFYVELPLFQYFDNKILEFYGSKHYELNLSVSMESYNSYINIVIPAELSPTKKEYIAFKFSIRELYQNLIDSNPALEFKNTISLYKILNEQIFYGDLQSAASVGSNKRYFYELVYYYNLNDLENLKKQSPQIKELIDQVPYTITPASFE